MVPRRARLLLAALLVLGACAGDDFGREDAIVALATTGLSEVESTCVADTLAALDQLDAADPRKSRGDAQRAALVSATGHCVTSETIVLGAQARSEDPVDEDEDPEGTPLGAPGALSNELDPAQRRQRAVAQLELAGRSVENADCVVDQLIASQAEAVLDDPAFGLGLDPLEADAFATCI